MPRATIKFKGKQPLMKELQRLVSFRCYNDVVGSGGSKKVNELHNLVFNKYHGPSTLTQPSQEEDHITYCDQLLKGVSMFEPLYRVETDIAEGEDVLVLKEIFSCQATNRVIVSDKKEDQGINKAVVTSKSLSNIANLSGRSIWDNAKMVEKNGKKALAILEHSEYQQYYKDGGCPSGKVYEDYLLFMRRAMYKELKGDIVDDEDDSKEDNYDEEQDDDEEEDGMPSSYFFPGFLAFALWGPIMPPGFDEEYRAQCFFRTEQSKDKKKDGRNSIRKEQSEEDSKTRSGSSASEGRGLTNKEHLLMASIAQQSAFQQAFQSSRLKESRLLLLNETVKQADSDVSLWMKHCTSKMFDAPDRYKDHFAFKNLMEAMEKKRNAQVELEQAMRCGDDAGPNKYQDYVDLTLDSHMLPSSSKKAKRSTVSASNSVSITSVNIPNQKKGSEEELGIEDLVTMSTAAQRMPDGSRMCLSTEEYEKRCGYGRREKLYDDEEEA